MHAQVASVCYTTHYVANTLLGVMTIRLPIWTSLSHWHLPLALLEMVIFVLPIYSLGYRL